MSDWNQSNIDHRDFQHSDRREDWEEVKHRRKSSKGCKRSKDKQHDYSNVVKRTLSLNGDYWWIVLECSKCGKRDWKSYDFHTPADPSIP